MTRVNAVCVEKRHLFAPSVASCDRAVFAPTVTHRKGGVMKTNTTAYNLLPSTLVLNRPHSPTNIEPHTALSQLLLDAHSHRPRHVVEHRLSDVAGYALAALVEPIASGTPFPIVAHRALARFPILNETVSCPKDSILSTPLWQMISHLEFAHNYDREQIAVWLRISQRL